MFWITVGHASRHTARAMGPSTIDRSSLRAGCAIADRSYFSVAAATSQRPVAGTSYQLPVTSYQVASFQRGLVTRYWRLVTGDWLLATGYWRLATGYWLLERITRLRVARIEAALEPRDALLRGSVRELLRHDAAGAELLQAIVAGRGRGAQRFLHVARIEFDPACRGSSRLRRLVAPHAGIAVGLQLEAHRHRVRAARIRTLRLAHLSFRAHQRLHVMADLVREHVGLREVARRAETAIQFIVETEIEIDLAIAGTIEGTSGGARVTARRVDRIAEQHHSRGLVAIAEQLRPHLLVVARDGVHHVHHLFFRRRRGRPPGRSDGARVGRRAAAAASEYVKEVHTCEHAEQCDDDEPADSERNHPAAAPRAAPQVFNVASIARTPAHQVLRAAA